MSNDAIDFKAMSHQHFYENYWLMNGQKPPPLSDFDKAVLAAYDNLNEGERLFVFKARGGHRRLAKIAQDKAIAASKQLNSTEI